MCITVICNIYVTYTVFSLKIRHSKYSSPAIRNLSKYILIADEFPICSICHITLIICQTGSEEARLAYNEAKEEAKVRVRKAKNEEWIRLGEEMEKDAKGMQKRFWSRVKAKEKETVTHIRGLDGELRSGEEAVNRWREHFENLLNGDAGSGEEATADGNEVRNDEGGIEVEEVERAVRKLKSGKAGGVCGIQVEMVKAGGWCSG